MLNVGETCRILREASTEEFCLETERRGESALQYVSIEDLISALSARNLKSVKAHLKDLDLVLEDTVNPLISLALAIEDLGIEAVEQQIILWKRLNVVGYPAP